MASEDVREVVPEIVATMSNAIYKGEKGTFNDLTPEQKESLRGPRGYQGPQGDTGPKGATGPQGEQGPAGVDGEDGITPEITVSNITGGHTISISYGVEDPRNSSFNVMDGTNGSNGSAGQNGSDGITPIITATTIAGGHNISISYGTDDPRNTNFDVLDGQDGAAGADGQDGVDGAPGADGPAGADGADGITPDITVTSITGGHTVTIDYGSGDSRNTSFNVMDGATGATGPAGTYTAGTGISISNGQISLSSNPVPAILNGDAGKVLAVNSGENGVEWATPASGGTSLPSDPSGDGTYVLTNTVASGSATQSWEAASSGGGSSYSAGDGISISSGGVISRNPITPSEAIMLTVPGTNLSNDGSGNTLWAWGDNLENYRVTTIQDFADMLSKNKMALVDGISLYSGITPRIVNTAAGTNWTFWTRTVSSYNGAVSSTSINLDAEMGQRWAYMLYIRFGDQVLKTAVDDFKNWLAYYRLQQTWAPPSQYNNYTKLSGKYHAQLETAISGLDSNLGQVKTRCPDLPRVDGSYVDGTYTLQVTVSSGTPTYSWVANT